MSEEPRVAHAVSAVLRLTGAQQVRVSVEHPRTPQAVLTVGLGRSLIYMHTPATTERFSQVWREARLAALQLPRARQLVPQRQLGLAAPDIAEPSVVVHAAGRPVASARLTRQVPHSLSITIGGIAFLVYDQRAYAACAEAFIRADALGQEQLATYSTTVSRHIARGSGVEPPTLSGRDAERAAGELAATAWRIERGVHPAVRAAGIFRPQPGAATPRPPAAGTDPPGRSPATRLGLYKPPGPTTGRSR